MKIDLGSSHRLRDDLDCWGYTYKLEPCQYGIVRTEVEEVVLFAVDGASEDGIFQLMYVESIRAIS